MLINVLRTHVFLITIVISVLHLCALCVFACVCLRGFSVSRKVARICMLMCDSSSHCVPTQTPTGVYVCVFVCVCIHRYSFTRACVRVCAYAFVCVFACVCACVTSSISMEIKRCSSHEFTHSPCFDSIQSTVCIITLVPYGNLLGPKYCSLTNPSFVFSRYTKHQSCFSTHAVHHPTPPHTHTPSNTPTLPPNTHTHNPTPPTTPLPTPQKHRAVWNRKLAD